MSTPSKKAGGQLSDTVERKSRLVSLAYKVLGAMDLPPLDATEGEILSALASAFHVKALVVGRTERDAPRIKPALPENKYSVFETRMWWSTPREETPSPVLTLSQRNHGVQASSWNPPAPT
jgi:hypothetical protein